MGNAISSFLFPDFKPVHGSENLNTGRPLTLERIAAESREPKNAANWDVHYFKKICHELGIKMGDIQNAEAALPLNKKFLLETLPSTHLVRIPSDSTAKPISASKEIISSYYLINALHSILKNSSEFTKTDKKYILIGTAITLLFALLSGGLALFSGVSLAITIFFVGLDALFNALLLCYLHKSNRSILLKNYCNISNQKNLGAYTEMSNNRSNTIQERFIQCRNNADSTFIYFIFVFFVQLIAPCSLIHLSYLTLIITQLCYNTFIIIKASLLLYYARIETKKSVICINHLKNLIFTGKLDISNIHAVFGEFFKNIQPAPTLPTQALPHIDTEDSITLSQTNRNTGISDEAYQTFKLLLPHLPSEDKKNLRLVSKSTDCLVRENVTFIQLKKLNIDEVLKVFPYIENIEIDDTISRENIEKLLEMKHLKAIDIDLSKSPNINFWEIDPRLRQKITHLKCTGQQIRNIDLTEPSSSLPQLTHLDILNPLDENFNSFISNSRVLSRLKCLKMQQELYQPILQELAWPETLTELQLIGFKNRELPQLPQSLTSLTLSCIESLEALPQQLPQSLASLRLYCLDKLYTLPQQLPQSLASLTLYRLSKLYRLPEQLPQSLASLRLEYLPKLYTLPEQLPQSLASLTLERLPDLEALPQHLPQSLTSLTLSYIESLEALPQQLPQSLACLTLSRLRSLHILPQQLPQNLASLTLKQLDSLEALPQQLPQSLAFLTLENLANLRTLPQQLPQSLASLTLERLPDLEALPQQLPQSLASLTLENLANLRTLPQQLPQKLTFLTLDNLPSLRILPKELPQSIRHLNFNIDPELIRISSTENRPDTI